MRTGSGQVVRLKIKLRLIPGVTEIVKEHQNQKLGKVEGEVSLSIVTGVLSLEGEKIGGIQWPL